MHRQLTIKGVTGGSRLPYDGLGPGCLKELLCVSRSLVLLATLRDDALLDVESAQQTLPAEVQALERAAVKIKATVEASRSYWLTLQAALGPAPGAHSLLL